jgi:4-amino-4-deoxy-L-arabinose transferase-like glycosyltransferase
MTPTSKITILIAVLLVVGGAIVAQFIQVPERVIYHPAYTRNTGELTGTALVGQTFVAKHNNLAAVAVQFATYSNRNNTKPIIFNLRQWPDGADIRQASVLASELGDNQLHRFEFEPIPDSANKTYFFYVVSPDSVPGNAVTVDIDTRNPYIEGTAFIVHAAPTQLTNPAVISGGGKLTVDVAFATWHTVPLRVAATNTVIGSLRTLVGTWEERQGGYRQWALAAVSALLFVLTLFLVRPTYPKLVLSILLIAAIALRLLYAQEMPLTADEGNYLYDAKVLLEGRLAGGDGYVKAPLFVGWVALWQLIMGATVLAGRMSSVVIGALTLIPLYILGKHLWSQKVGLMAAAAWAFFGAPIVFTIYVHTQPVALFFGVSGLALLLVALQDRVSRRWSFFLGRKQASLFWLFCAGALLGLGVASRKSILAMGLVPLLFIAIHGTSWRQWLRYLVAVGFGFVVILALFFGTAYWIYGTQGVWEAIGINSAEDGATATTDENAEQVRAYSLRGMTPFFRESLPLILLAVLGLGVAGEVTIRTALRYLQRRPSRQIIFVLDHLVPKLAWVVSVVMFWWAWSFFAEYEGSAFMQWGIPILWWLMGLVVLGVATVRRPLAEALRFEEKPLVPYSTQPGLLRPAPPPPEERRSVMAELLGWLVIPLWVGGLAFFYMNWIKFHANYIAEFIPPLVLLAGYGAVALKDRFVAARLPWRWVQVASVLVLLYAITISNYITALYEHTGTFQLGSVHEAAAWAREHIQPDQAIFTGAAAIPYLSGHRVTLDIAHPRWYAYEFVRTQPERLNTFLPPAETMVEAFRQTQWFLLEQQTGFSFLMEYTEIEKALEEKFILVHSVENGSNTLKFYQRTRP